MNQMQYQSNKVTDIDCLNFAALQAYTSQMVGTARIWVNHAAQKRPDDQITLFVHGAYHGAWCYAGFLQFFDRLDLPAAAIDLTGHGGLVAPDNFVDMGVSDFATDIQDAVMALDRPIFLVGHSAGALIASSAAQHLKIAGLGLLAPSPPGNLTGARMLPEVPTEKPLPIPNHEALSKTYFVNDPLTNVDAVHRMLCPESPALMNDRYRLQAVVDPCLVDCSGFCFEAGNDDPERHPKGQDQRVAEFFELEHIYLANAPHCLMISHVWEQCAALLAKKTSRET